MGIRGCVLATALVALGGLPPATASAVVDPACLGDPVIGSAIFGEDLLPTLTNKNEPVDVAVWDALLENCPNTTVTARTPGGGLITVPLDQNLPDNPPDLPERLGGVLVLPLGYGAGVWQLTKITSGTTSKTLHHPFAVHRGGTVSLTTPLPVTAPNPVTVSGSVKHYTSTGSLAASPNTTVAVYTSNPVHAVRRYLTTNSAGTFSGTVAMPPGSTPFAAEVAPGTYYYADSPTRNATVNQAGQPAISVGTSQHSATGYVNSWWRIDVPVTPGTLWNDLQLPTQLGWKTSGSFGYSPSSGMITRWWKPVSANNYTLRLQYGAAGVQPNGPAYEIFHVTVKSKQTIPTYVDAVVAPTNGGTVYRGTPMTSYGHLKVRYSNGTIGPFTGQRILVQTRPSGTNAGWATQVGSAVTGSNGYFVLHWAMPDKVGTDVRFLYLSPYVTIKNGSTVKTGIQVSQ